ADLQDPHVPVHEIEKATTKNTKVLEELEDPRRAIHTRNLQSTNCNLQFFHLRAASGDLCGLSRPTTSTRSLRLCVEVRSLGERRELALGLVHERRLRELRHDLV